MLQDLDQCLEPDYWPSRRKRVELCLMICWFRLDSESFRVTDAVGVGTDVGILHSCHCGGRMNSRGLHGLSCKYNAGCFSRHSAIDNVIKRTLALQKADLPSVLG